MKIENIDIKNNLILAPMEAVNCSAFMKTCADFGADLVNTQAIERVEKNFYNLKNFEDIKTKKSFQILTGSIEQGIRLVKQVEEHVDLIDLNFGCPLNEVLGKKYGGYLLQYPHVIQKLATAIVKESSIPITAKIRLGFDKKRENFLEVAQALEESGISAITLHARYVKEKYTKNARWEKIKELKEKSTVPIIANGDIGKQEQVKYIIEKKYADGVMIGRAAKNNPAIFAELQGKKTISLQKIWNTFNNYYSKQEKQSLGQLQDHACWIVSSNTNAKSLKASIRQTRTFEEINNIIKTIK